MKTQQTVTSLASKETTHQIKLAHLDYLQIEWGSWDGDVYYSTQYVHLASPTKAHTHLHMVNPVQPCIPVEGLVLTQMGNWDGKQMANGWLC